MSKSIVLTEAKELASQIIIIYKSLSNDQNEFVISKQLLKSGTSVGANITEALFSISKKEFIMKLQIALKECAETLYWLELLEESGYLKNSYLSSDTKEKASKIKAILINILKTSKQNMSKFHSRDI